VRIAVAVVCLVTLASVSLAQDLLAQAKAAEQQGKTGEAIQLYRDYLREHPNEFTALYSLGALLLRSGQAREALEPLLKAKEVAPTRLEPPMALANAYLSLNDPYAALDALVAAEKQGERVPEYWSLRAGIELLLGDARAVESIQRAVNLTPSRYDILMQAASILGAFGKHSEAAKAYRDAARLNPIDPAPIASGAHALLNAHRAQEAAELCASAYARFPQNPEIPEAHARALLAQGKPNEALAVLDAAQDRGIPRISLATARAECLQALQRPNEALAVLDEALASRPDDARALAARARLHLLSKQFKDAERDADMVMRVAPRWREAYLLALEVARAQRKARAEEVILRNWIANAPEHPEPYPILLQILVQREAWTEAAVLADVYLKIRPNDQAALGVLAQAFLVSGDVGTAIERLNAAFARGIESEQLYLYLALCYRKQQANAEAIRALETLVRKYPTSERGWSLLATIQEPQRPDAALAVYDRMLQALPGNLEAIKGRARMLSRLQRHEDSAREWVRLAVAQGAMGPYYFAAMEWKAAGKANEADAMFAHLRERHKDDIELLAVQGQYLADSERLDEAAATFREITRIAPSDSKGYLSGGRALIDRGRPDAALELLAVGAEHLYRDFQYFRLLEEAALKAKKPAVLASVTAELVDRGRFSVPMVVAYVNAQAQNKNLAAAIARLERAGQEKPNEMAVFFGLARAKAMNNDAPGALEALDRAVELAPGDVEVLQVYAQAAEAANDPKRAARAYGLLAVALPNDTRYVLKQAGYLNQLGRKDEAIAVLRQARERFPDDGEIAEMLRALGG
jgi:tetratricopeptide (TPR) repeat protein